MFALQIAKTQKFIENSLTAIAQFDGQHFHRQY